MRSDNTMSRLRRPRFGVKRPMSETSTRPLPIADKPRRAPTDGSDGNRPGSALGSEFVVCRHCQGSNPGARKFCGHCGKSLWEPCPNPKCHVEGPATETFCAACGAHISALHQERAARFEADLIR